MTANELLTFDARLRGWAHESQLPPTGEGWRVWLMMAGRGFGKTRAGAEWIYRLANAQAGRQDRAGRRNDRRRAQHHGRGRQRAARRRERRRRKLELGAEPGAAAWPNGSEAQLFSGDNADGLRGPEHDFAWGDELAKWRAGRRRPGTNLQFGLRRGPRPRALVTTTPRPMRAAEADRGRSVDGHDAGRTSDNINLDERDHRRDDRDLWRDADRRGRSSTASCSSDVEGALWPRE